MFKKSNVAISVLASLLVIVLPTTNFASAESTAGTSLCVDWQTKQIKFSKDWAKCPSKSSPLNLENIGAIGPKGEPGPAGAVGPIGPAGPSGSGFNIANYPALALDNSLIQEQPCANDARWSAIISRFGFANIEVDAFGQPIRNKQWAIDLAAGCNYPYSTIFSNPKVAGYSNLVVGNKTRFSNASGQAANYTPYLGWRVPITSVDIDVTLDSGWHFCTSADPQFSAINMSTVNSRWSSIDADTLRWTGNDYLTWESVNPNSSDKPQSFGSEGYLTLPYFCGPSDNTPSGLAAKRLGSGGFISYLIPKTFSEFN